jgi:hypothetical protein
MPGCRLLEVNGSDALADSVYGKPPFQRER